MTHRAIESLLLTTVGLLLAIVVGSTAVPYITQSFQAAAQAIAPAPTP